MIAITITRVEVRNPQGEILTLVLDNSENGYEVRGIDGLDPVPATIVSSSFADEDGEQYQTAHREKRNIVFKLGYDPDYATTNVRALRSNLYRYFMPKAKVHLRFFSDELPPVDIHGDVEDMDSPLFSQDPMATISVLCLLPDFFNPTSTVVEGMTVASTEEQEVLYPGNIETGILFKLMPDRNIDSFIIYHRPPDNSMRQLEFIYPLLADDILSINTVPRNKYVILRRDGSDDSVLYGQSPTSNWIQLFPGVNNIRVYAEGAPIPFTIEYTDKFGAL